MKTDAIGLVAFRSDIRDASHKNRIIWLRPFDKVLTIAGARGASARAIVSEILSSARTFADTGETAVIDLRCLKSMPEEREILTSLLGEGEATAVVDSVGRTDIYETSVACVWWVRHCNHEGETVGELIEITAVPEIIVGDRRAVVQGLEALGAALSFHALGSITHPQAR